MDKAKYSDVVKTQRLIDRKPDSSLKCSRCHSLKNESKLLEYEPQSDVTQLAQHVQQFNRKEIIR